MLVALAVAQKRHFITLNIAQAYLNADMPDEVYMTLDKTILYASQAYNGVSSEELRRKAK